MTCGKFITLEGGEGVGKTTQATVLVEFLRSRAIDTLLTREPGGSTGAELIRELLVQGHTKKWDGLTEAYLFAAARADHVSRLIKPNLEAGCWVVCDRFVDSSVAYQGYGRGLDPEWIHNLNLAALDELQPDLTLVLDLAVPGGLMRASSRQDSSRFEKENVDFHLRVRQGFGLICGQYPDRCVMVDASGSASEVRKSIWEIVEKRLLT